MASCVWLYALVLLMRLTLTQAGLNCFECTRIPFPRDCNHVTQCGDHEVCHTKQFVSDSGHLFYDTGCIDTMRCRAKRSIADDPSLTIDDETGDIIACSECCNSDYCNSRGCGSKPLPPFPESRGPLCFSCQPGTISPEDCDLVTVCSRDEHCFIEPINGIGGDHLYQTGCKKCGGLDAILVGKRSTSSCSGCCRTDFCNHACSSVSSMTPSVTDIVSPTSPSTTISVPTKPTSMSTIPSTLGTTTFYSPMFCRNHGYSYDADHGICYKIYDQEMKTMAEANASCQSEHADLLQLRDNQTEKYFIQQGYQGKNISDRRYWLGASRRSDTLFYWFNGKPLTTKHYTWGISEPNNMNGHEDCLEFMYTTIDTKEGQRGAVALNDNNCEGRNYYICEERCPDKNYTYFPEHDLCIKLHTTPLMWDQAQSVCHSEHAELAEPDTPEKIDFLHNYLTQFKSYIYWIGGKQYPHDAHKFYWVTTGQTILRTLWHSGEPNNPEEKCASLYWYNREPLDRLFRINDLKCDTQKQFICQYLW